MSEILVLGYVCLFVGCVLAIKAVLFDIHHD